MPERRFETADSQMIVAVSFEPDDQCLEIEFTNGTIYRYFMVPEHVYDDLKAAESAGRFFLTHIKGRFPYRET